MLNRLSIRNFVLVDEAEIRLRPGLTILSGETGGGKSVLATAIGLFAGGRARPGFVRKGAASASIEGEFGDAPRTMIVRRELDASGRSRAVLDGAAVGAGALKQALGRLLCITSQHEQVTLMSPEVQRDMLDDHGGLAPELEAYGRLFSDWREARETARRLADAAAQRDSRMDFLRHQVEELRGAALRKGEDDDLRSRLAVVKNRGRISEAVTLALRELFAEDEGVQTKVARTAREVDKVAASAARLEVCSRLLGEVLTLLGELERALGDAAETLEFDASSVDAMQARLYEIERLKKKHRGGIEEILSSLAAMQEELAVLDTIDDSLREAQRRAADLEGKLLARAEKISGRRRRAAAGLRKAVMKELADLAFRNVDFDVEVRSRREEAGVGSVESWLDEHGGDDVEFLLRPNVGEDFAPLRRIASGGELSRVLLALKVALRSGGGGETFIFDEIDVGIGGAVAEAVGRKLYRLGRTNQVICITHLPQIAAFADEHMLVGKRVEKGRTTTYVTTMDEKGRQQELARMMGGEKVTAKGREAAVELLAAAAQFKSMKGEG